MVVSRSSSSGSEAHTNRMISAGPGIEGVASFGAIIPDVRPIRSAVQLLPSSSNVRTETPMNTAAEGCQRVIARLIYGHLGLDATSPTPGTIAGAPV